MDRLDAMNTLVHVVREGSFAAAGRRLGLPRAAVSKHVSFLESSLGERFFHRTTRRLSLTDAGGRFYERCAKISPKHRTNDNRFMRHLVLEGHGVAQLPSYFVSDDLAGDQRWA
jgi:DNA-binding transcriptional LysR family regulator